MNCKICQENAEKVFSKNLLGKFIVDYHKCKSCGFMQTDEPYWLGEAYANGAISALDVGIAQRNLTLVISTENVLNRLKVEETNFIGLDYGGGHGLFVRMMRDIGYNFYLQDLYAENIFANFFDIKDLNIQESQHFDIITAFELFEHLPNPLDEIKKMFEFSDTILFSTELQPADESNKLADWWYLIPEVGQHISFYTISSFLEIAKVFGAQYFSDNKSLHILTKENLTQNPFLKSPEELIRAQNMFHKIIMKLEMVLVKAKAKYSTHRQVNSLILKDFEFVKQHLKSREKGF